MITRIGHRGAPTYRPENTIVSFHKAMILGCDGIELDVRLCKSGEPVVIHDATLDRTTNGSGLVADFTLEELHELEINGVGGIPTLAEVLESVSYQDLILIEIKEIEAVEPVAKVIKNCITTHGFSYNRLIAISFLKGVLRKIKECNDKIEIGASFCHARHISEDKFSNDVFSFSKLSDISKIILEFRPYSLNPFIKDISPEMVKLAHKGGCNVFTWTGKTADDIEQAVKAGADGIMVDDPLLFCRF